MTANYQVLSNAAFMAFVSANKEKLGAAVEMYEERPAFVRNFFAEFRSKEFTIDELTDLCDTIRAAIKELECQ